uniref:Somatostatin-2 n=1 Tax=Cynoglossus semilaevis TaxID=244447 RepID=A0A3P8ULJ6_CYNSE
MLPSQMHVLLVVLFPSITLSFSSLSNFFILQDHLLRLMTKPLAERVVEKMLVKLEEDEEDEEKTGAGEKKMMMQRHPTQSQRERKTGCRNFFWKTFTSC